MAADRRRWTRSSHSDTGAATCVEAAEAAGQVLVRDSKRVSGPQLALGPDAWRQFLRLGGR
ncbi:DUF397 domain-containing protein [Streptodolium elevatio]|uniref:DUF397 domain-containing protein n=1 Tax=Streptodolium elevatio TaxID=3157996 RepID=A0ABV3D9S8_9ACTN